MIRILRTTTLAVVLSAQIAAAQAPQGSVGCADLAQAAAAGMGSRIEADDRAIPAPQSVLALTCLDGFFNGVGLNVLSDLLDPGKLLNAVSTRALLQACTLARGAWNSAIGSAQCGLTISGFNMGFGGFNFGGFCPRLSFGGGGPALGSASLSPGAQNNVYLNGSPMGPIGYPITQPLGRQGY